MKVYVVWKTIYDEAENSYVLGVYKKLSMALKKCNNLNKGFITRKEDIETRDDEFIGSFSTIGSDDNMCYCAKIKVNNDTNKVYFMNINESSGGESYHGECSIHASRKKNRLIDIAKDYFSNEHDRNCEDCAENSNRCRKKLIRNLKNHDRANIECTNYINACIVIECINLI